MMKHIGMTAILFVLTMFCSTQTATAGWFENAVESAKERAGTRAVDEAVDGAYGAAKGTATGKEKGAGKATRTPSGSAARGAEPEHSVGPDGEAIDDEHFIQKDDFFVSDTPLERRTYIYVHLAKMVTEPSARTKGQAEFFKIQDGTNVWSKYYYQTRIAQDGEIRLGTQVIAFDSHRGEGNVYLSPETKEDARGRAWFLAKITDVSDLYRGYVTVSGNYKVSPQNLRIILPKSAPPVQKRNIEADEQ